MKSLTVTNTAKIGEASRRSFGLSGYQLHIFAPKSGISLSPRSKGRQISVKAVPDSVIMEALLHPIALEVASGMLFDVLGEELIGVWRCNTAHQELHHLHE